MHKKAVALTFLILGFIFDLSFSFKKNKRFCPAFVFQRDMSNAIYNLVLCRMKA